MTEFGDSEETHEFDEESDLLKQVDFRRYVLRLVKAWRTILLVTILFAAFGISLALMMRGKSFITTAVILRTEKPVGVMVGDGSHFELPTLSLSTLVDTVKLATNLKRIAEKIDYDSDLTELANRITLIRPNNSNLIMIEGRGSTRKEAVDLANSTADVFVEYLIELKGKEISDAIKNLDDMVESTEKKLNKASNDVTEFRKKHGIVLLDVETELYLQKINEIKTTIENTKADLSAVQREAATLSRNNTTGGGYSGERLQQLKQRLAKLRASYTDDNPQIQKIFAEIDAVSSSSISEEKRRLSLRIGSLRGRIGSLQAQLNTMQGKLSHLTSNEKDYAAVQQRFLFIKQMLHDLMGRREEALAMKRDISGEFRVIEKAVSPKMPVASKAKLVAVAVPITGLFLVIFLLLVSEFLSSVIMSAKEVNARYSLKIIGQHLNNPQAKKDAPCFEPDVFRSIVSTMTVENKLGSKRVVGFLATEKGDGLSTVVNSLASAYCTRGLRVLVVDVDIHDEEKEGTTLEQYIDENISLDSLIESSDEKEPDRLCAGFTHTGQLELLGNLKLDNAIKILKEKYDLIFFDTPPAFDYIQVVELIPRVEALVFVVKAGSTKKDRLERIVRQFGNLGTPVVGVIVANAVPFLVRRQEIVATNAYRKVIIGRGFVERFILGKIMS